jgi:hypothetical protein
MGRRRLACVPTLFAVSLLGALVALPGGASGAGSPAACSARGIHFVGATSQKQAICFTLSPSGKLLREYVFDYLDACGSGTVRSVNPMGVTSVTAAGVFAKVSFDGFFKGTIRSRTATGTFRQHDEGTVPGAGRRSCDTHVVRWTAHRAG